MTENPNIEAALLKELAEKVKNVRITMLTTIAKDGGIHSRPMATQEIQPDGSIWFFTYGNSGKSREVKDDAQVNLSYADPSGDTYISISGTGRISKDKTKMKELWNPFLKAWFPEGLDTPDLVLIQVRIHSAEFWDSHQSKMVQLIKMVAAMFTGVQPDLGEHKILDM
jgi:general stress protein 26